MLQVNAMEAKNMTRLIRWEPWQPLREVERLQREMNRLFDTLSPEYENDKASFFPPAELYETPEAVHLKLEIPGIEAKDLDVQVTAEGVAISGERRTETQTEENGLLLSEFRYGKFQRVIPMPVRIQNDKVVADYQNGILNLSLPKAEEEKNRVVKVKIS